jgi:hypothetical protein
MKVPQSHCFKLHVEEPWSKWLNIRGCLSQKTKGLEKPDNVVKLRICCLSLRFSKSSGVVISSFWLSEGYSRIISSPRSIQGIHTCFAVFFKGKTNNSFQERSCDNRLKSYFPEFRLIVILKPILGSGRISPTLSLMDKRSSFFEIT